MPAKIARPLPFSCLQVQYRSLYSVGMCTIEGNTGIIAATGTNPLTATNHNRVSTFLFSQMCQATPQAL